MSIFKKLKLATNWIPFKDRLRPIYMPLLEKIKFIHENKIFLKSSNDVLVKSHLALNELGITYWLEFGTLLGFVRDNGFIKHDRDIDFGVLLDEYDDSRVIKTFESHGFKLKHKMYLKNKSGLEISFSLNNVTVDLFYFSIIGQNMYCHLFPLLKNSNERYAIRLSTKYSGFKPIKFKNLDFSIPNDEYQRLIDTYGEGYKIPNKNWDTMQDAFNASRIDDKVIFKGPD